MLHSSADYQWLKGLLRDMCISAGLESRHTVLLVSGAACCSEQGWDNVCQLMNEGKPEASALWRPVLSKLIPMP